MQQPKCDKLKVYHAIIPSTKITLVTFVLCNVSLNLYNKISAKATKMKNLPELAGPVLPVTPLT